jgi:hypothetical protein
VSQPLHLVACVAGKLGRPAPARELYTSDWFRKARAYVEALGAPWMILSAQHGLLDPAQVVAPYDATLIGAPEWRRLQWGEAVGFKLFELVPNGGRVVALAGQIYRDAITQPPPWRMSRIELVAPMAGLGIGEQKQWLARNVAQLQPTSPRQKELDL